MTTIEVPIRQQPAIEPPAIVIDPVDVALEGAAEYLEKYGWVNHQPSYVYGSPACAAVALLHVNEDIQSQACGKLASYLGLDPTKGEHVPNWNDSRSSMEEVCRALRGAAASTKKEE